MVDAEPTQTAIRCDHCRKSLGLIIHRYWRMRFCSAKCLSAYQHRLDEAIKAKMKRLAA
jgi:hypothetical protein